jgi:uncharacterized heparinase superfamily protein
MSSARLLLYMRTLRYLKATQFWHQLSHRVPKPSALTTPSKAVVLRQILPLRHLIALRPLLDTAATFTFLHREKAFGPGQLDWSSKDMPKLWRYNLHYFDYLQDAHRSTEDKYHLISDWIEHNPPGTEEAWEPYTASLRIVNWVKYFLLPSSTSINANPLENGSTGGGGNTKPKPEWLESLYQQALWLERNIEYHILANHYLKNGVALFFAGVYFDGVDADRWLKKGLKILREELAEQFLADGGHYERSPMYHSICVTDYLDILNLAQNSQGALSLDEQTTFTQKITTSLNFLTEICVPDDDIPLLNDSAFGVAPSPEQIFEYSKKVIGYDPPVKPSGLTIHNHVASGYFTCRNGQDSIFIDCGNIGPDYQPGHAHCDTLSFELAINGQRVFVDSGVYDYEPSPERAYARSTKAHNTVVVDGEEQSEIWGVFRVARRAKPLHACLDQRTDGSALFTGAHDGYARLAGNPIHKRSISYDGNENWMIEDRLEGRGQHRMESYLHVHPDYHVVPTGPTFGIIEASGNTMAIVEPLGLCQVRVEQGWYFPEFGLKYENHVIVFFCSGEIPLGLSYRIQKVSRRSQ